MMVVRRFSSWYSRQKISGKLAVGCGGLLLLCCVCSVPITILNPSPVTENKSAEVIEAPESPTELVPLASPPTDTTTPTKAPQATPTKTASPSTTTPTATSDVIIETAKIIDASIEQVEAILGSSTETFSLSIGEVEEVPDGGETRTYQVGKYTIWVNYDKKGIAKGLQVIDGLIDDGYSLDEWVLVLDRIGVDFVGLPDIEAPAARRWTDAYGYAIMIAAEKIDGNIWTVRIYKIP